MSRAVPEPVALCIEDLEDGKEETKFIRCVALVGTEPGLGIDAQGRPLWRATKSQACELWVSGDARLMLSREAHAVPVVLHRVERRLEVPAGKPVVVLDQDELEIGGKTLRLHVHGSTTVIHPPEPFIPSWLGAAAALVAAVQVGGAVLGCERDEVSPEPVSTVVATATGSAPGPTASSLPGATSAPAPTATQSASASAAPSASSAAPVKSGTKRTPPIEVRPRPPRMAPSDF